MANKKVIIEVEVDSKQVDQAVAKTGELRKLSDRISIQYDIDGRPLDLVINKSLNLQQQVKAITAELRKTKEGTAEFQLLSKELGAAQDGLAKTTAKSKDLFTSLSMIPGPVGQFFQQLSGAIELLKVFSSFTFKDLKFQLGEVADDIGDISKNLSGVEDEAVSNLTENLNDADGAAKEAKNATDGLSESLKDVSNNAADAASNLVANVSGNDELEKSIKGLRAEQQEYFSFNQRERELLFQSDDEQIVNLRKLRREFADTFGVQANLLNAASGDVKDYAISFRDANEKLQTYTQEQAKAAIATGTLVAATGDATKGLTVQTVATNVLDKAEKTLVATTEALSIVLKGLGIGLIIAAVVALGQYLYKLGEDLFGVTEQAKGLQESFKKGSEAMEDAKNKVIQVKIAFDEARKGTISKRQALEQYNEILGGTIGKADTLAEAEKLYNANTESYIKSTGLRAEAQALYSLAAQKSAEALSAQQVSFFSFERGLFQGYDKANIIDRLVGRKGELQERIATLNTDAVKFRSLAADLVKESLKLQIAYKPKEEPKKTDTVQKKENENEQLIEKEKQLQAELTALKTKGERERELQDITSAAEKEKRDISALKITKDKEALRTQALLEVDEKVRLKKEQINKKYDDAETKKKEEITKKLAEFELNAMMEGFEKQKTEVRKKNEEELKELKKLYDDKLITKDQYDKAVLNSNTTLANAEIKIEEDKKKQLDEKKKKEQDEKLNKLDNELKFLEMSNEANKNSFEAYWKGRQDFLDKSKERELAELDLTEDQKLAIEKKYNKLSKDLQREKFEAYVGYLSQGLAAAQSIMSQQSQITNQQQQLELDDLQLAYNKQQEFNAKTIKDKDEYDKQTIQNDRLLAEAQDKVKEEYFYKNRAAQKSQAMISAFQAAISAYSSLAAIPVVGPFLGAAAAAVALAFGIKQANLIGQQKYVSSVAAEGPEPSKTGSSATAPNYGRNYADGGMIGGNRHSDGGTMIEAERGEAIMTRGAVTMFQPMLSMMNQMGGGTSFAPSLVSTSYDNPKVSNPSQDDRPTIIKSYVVSSELTSEANKQARLKDLSTI
jgi:hypothetical protein